MEKELKDKIDTLVKSMQKSVKKMKDANAVEDVLDSDRVAEMDEDEVAVGTTDAMNKSKKKKSLEKCDGVKDCDCKCDQPPAEKPGMEKTEEFVKEIMGNFKKISDAYLNKNDK